MNLRDFVLTLESYANGYSDFEMTPAECGELAKLIRGRVGAAFEGIALSESIREALQEYDDAMMCARLRKSWEGTES